MALSQQRPRSELKPAHVLRCCDRRIGAGKAAAQQHPPHHCWASQQWCPVGTIGQAENNMHDESRALFRQAIRSCLPNLHALEIQHSTLHQVWRKTGHATWHGEFEPRPDLVRIFRLAASQIKEAATTFAGSFFQHHPEYAGMVGFRGGSSNWAKNVSHIVRSALWVLWWRHKTFKLSDTQVDKIVQEFSDFLSNPTVRIQFQAQLVNFEMSADFIALTDRLAIRRLNEEEITRFHGGSVATLGFIRPRMSGIHEFAFEGELDEPKTLGGDHPPGETIGSRAQAVLDKGVLSLRTFKDGHIGYDYVHFRPVTFCPIGLFTQGVGDKYIPFGSYSLSQAEYEPLIAHAMLIFASSEPAMEMACSRLAEAQNRAKSRDRIVDAVIGMESLLLAALGKEDRRAELSFRFSMNYAMLYGTPEERHNAFRMARDLYGLRSSIAHGSSLDANKVKIAGETLTLSNAGKLATTALRTVITYFLTKEGAKYKKSDYWQRAYFGLPEPTETATSGGERR